MSQEKEGPVEKGAVSLPTALRVLAEFCERAELGGPKTLEDPVWLCGIGYYCRPKTAIWVLSIDEIPEAVREIPWVVDGGTPRQLTESEFHKWAKWGDLGWWGDFK